MKSTLYVFLLILISTAAGCQAVEPVAKIEFTTLTRGFQKQVFISADSVIAIVDGRQEDNRVQKRKLDGQEWVELMDALKEIKLQDIPSYESPSSRRAFDGARHSSIKIVTREGKEYQHGFDDEFPHEKLKALMEKIMNIEKGFELR